MNTESFDEEKHEYRIDGVQVPSVTWCLKDNGFIDDEFFTHGGKVRGLRVHVLCEFFDLDDYDPKQAEKYNLQGYVESWRKLRQRLGIEVYEVEKVLFDRTLRFGGRPDRLAWLAGVARPWILDLKSGGPEPWHGYQTAGYNQLYDCAGGYGALKRAGVHLQEDGSMAKFVEHDRDNDRAMFLAFLTTSHMRLLHKKTTLQGE